LNPDPATGYLAVLFNIRIVSAWRYKKPLIPSEAGMLFREAMHTHHIARATHSQ